jgi:D-alanine-D-alanine ligase
MRITVLCGGPSAEREVSLMSGKEVAAALRAAGHDVYVSDVSPTNLTGLDYPADVVFPVLHGAFGEDGEIQAILEQRGLPFVGSGSAASRVAIDKIATKTAWLAAGLPTPKWRVLGTLPPDPDEFGLPVVIKANRSGSSLGVYICHTEQQVIESCKALLESDGEVLMEQFIAGPELTVGLLDRVALPPIRIVVPKEGVYDYAAKYTVGGSAHEFDLGLPADVVGKTKELCLRASDVLGCRDLGRVDVMIDARDQQPYLLEINTLPGFTAVSLLPDAARQAGIAFPKLVDRLVRLAYARA